MKRGEGFVLATAAISSVLSCLVSTPMGGGVIVGGGVHDSYTVPVRTGWIFYFP